MESNSLPYGPFEGTKSEGKLHRPSPTSLKKGWFILRMAPTMDQLQYIIVASISFSIIPILPQYIIHPKPYSVYSRGLNFVYQGQQEATARIVHSTLPQVLGGRQKSSTLVGDTIVCNICIYMYIYVYVCIYVYIYIYICIHIVPLK